MENMLDKLMGIALAVVIGMMIRHPLTWRQELIKFEVQVSKELNSGWGCPSVWNPRTACKSYDPKRYK